MKIITVAVAALAMASPALAQEPPRQSAECLTEIAGLTYERLNMFEPDRVAAAQRKADQLYEAMTRLLASREAMDAAFVEAMAELAQQEADGTAPHGAVTVARRDFERERELANIDDDRILSQTPSCEWPEGFGRES